MSTLPQCCSTELMNFMNDSLRTDVCVRYSPETIACSCIWLAGRQLKIPLPENPPWYHVFGVNLSDIEKIAASIMKLYTRKKTKLKVLETKVEEVRLKLQEARLRKKAVSDVVSSEEASSFSSASGSSSPSNNILPQRSVLSQRALLPPRAFLPQRTVLPQRAIHHQKAVLHQSAMPRHQDEENGHALKDGSRMGVVEASPDLEVDVLVKRLNDLTKDPISRSRSRSHSRERYYKKKYSRSPSRSSYSKATEGRSVSRSRLRSRSPHPIYDKKYEKKCSKQNDRYDKLERHDKLYYVKDCRRYDHKDKSVKDLRRYDHKDKSVKDLRRYDHKDKYSSKYLEKLDKNKKRKMKKKYHESDYERHHRSKVNGRRRSRSKEREIRKG
ncbi:Cyclin-L2 [Armadillidium nasatum]|uniref:Cyclin-L2 n=1 Tax=Armadillidium nasatum TaxID=96803 RepID=A0A5N5TDU6_9CRUS|nr:Cyclin-L2 [Armadillidium nasatum]